MEKEKEQKLLLERIINKQIDNILGRIRIPLYAHDYSGYGNIHRCEIDGRVEIAPTAKAEYSDLLGSARILDFAHVDDSTVEKCLRLPACVRVFFPHFRRCPDRRDSNR